MEWLAAVDAVLADGGGLATRQALLRVAPKRVVDAHVASGRLQRVFPHVYTRRGQRQDDDLVLRAALLHVGPLGALSHETALHVWGLRPLRRPLHATVDQGQRRAGTQGLVVHRKNGFRPEAPTCTVVRGLRVTPLASSLVNAWPLLPRSERRPLLFDVVRERRATPEQLFAALEERANVGGHRELAQAIELGADGCQSELEAMGALRVFRRRGMPPSIGQLRLDIGSRAVFLDRAWPEVKLGVELDGARHHTSPEDRRRDLARDTALAALGWVVLRFTYAEVLHDPDGVRAKVMAVYRARLAQGLAG